MNTQQFASSPSDPLWAEPGWRKDHVHVVDFHHPHHDGNGDGDAQVGSAETRELEANTARREALDEAASKLNTLCATDAPVADTQNFLAQWEDPSSGDGRIQPNALAWFNDTNSVQQACANDNQQVLRLLLGKGLQPTSKAVAFAKAKWQETRNKDVLQLLLDYGWDINQPLNNDTPPLMRSVFPTSYHDPSSRRYTSPSKGRGSLYEPTPLTHHGSLLLSDQEMVRWCLSLGANPNASSPAGETILQRAAGYGSLDVLRLLVEHGCLVRDRDLVARACFYRKDDNDNPERLEVVRFLLDHGAPIDAYFAEEVVESKKSCLDVFIGKQNGLHLAIQGGNRDLVKLLIERGADRNLPTCSAMKTNGQTVSPVELARICGHEDMVTLLEHQDTSVNLS